MNSVRGSLKGWHREWQIVERGTASARLAFWHLPDSDWPFAFDAEQSFQLRDDGLTMALKICNRSDQPMPAGLGFHPFFPLVRGTHLQADWTGMWQMSEDKLPTTLVATPSDADFSQLRPVDNWKIDNCFVGWKRRAILDYPTHRVQLDASELCDNIVCFAPNDERNFIALEPVTNINNAFALTARGVVNTGVRVLKSGENMSISATINLTSRPVDHAAQF